MTSIITTATGAPPHVPATRLFHEFHPRRRYHTGDAATHVALYVDVETTGLDPHDAIIELAAVRFHYSPDTAAIYALDAPLHALEDPRQPIPPEITALTGLSDAALTGRRIDDDAVAVALRDVSVVVSHNARFDRPRLERRLPIFAKHRWACSMTDIPWKTLGFSSLNLECLLMKHCREYYDAHHAQADCYAGIHLLATPDTTGERPLALLLRAASIPTVRIWAVGSPLVLKDRLRARNYRWYPGDHRRPKAWFLDLPPNAVDTECEWLRQHIYAGRPGHIAFDHFDAYDRYSSRA
jgi:DNA polymerase-3 subunit epsilon